MDAALSGKVVVIIGGTSGIGLAAARACARAGAQIVCVGRDEESTSVAERELAEAARVFTAARAVMAALMPEPPEGWSDHDGYPKTVTALWSG